MRAISLWQPWASAIALGLKKIETRGRRITQFGPLAIHAAKTREHSDFLLKGLPEELREKTRLAFNAAGYVTNDQLPFGAIVAVVDLFGCANTEALHDLRMVSAEEKHWGNYEPGRFGWLLKDVRRLREPIPWKGSQGFFQVPDQLIELAFAAEEAK